MAVLTKPTLSHLVVISNDDAGDGFQDRTISPDRVDLSAIDPNSKFILFYGKAAKPLSEAHVLKERGYKFTYVDDYAAFQQFFVRIACEIENRPDKNQLRDFLAEKYNWCLSDFGFGASMSNYGLLRYYLHQTGGKLVSKEEAQHRRYAHVVHPADDPDIWAQTREKVISGIHALHKASFRG
ncbi:hypothetical protein LWV33_03145 [Brucella intermedia]